MKRLAGVMAITVSLGWAPMVAGQELAVDLSEEGVAITTGFSGANLLLFGATQGRGDVVVVVRGPTRSQLVRRKENVAGVWVNRKGVKFYNVPAFYTVAASRPLTAILTDLQRLDYQIGADKLTLVPEGGLAPDSQADAFREALLRIKMRENLYSETAETVKFVGERLFRTQIRFPANVPVGSYAVHVFLVDDGTITKAQTTVLEVRKVGFEARVYDFAHRYSAVYGLLAIVIAVVAGWLGSVLFRRA